jgi:hypothetical protein
LGSGRLVVPMILLMRIIQSASSCTCYRTNTSSYRSTGQRTDPRSSSRAKDYTLGGINMALVPNVSSIRMLLSFSGKIRHCRSNEQPR